MMHSLDRSKRSWRDQNQHRPSYAQTTQKQAGQIPSEQFAEYSL